MKVIVAGSRNFNNYKLLKEKLDKIKEKYTIEIVSGGANGADKFGEQYSKENNLKVHLFPADWNKFGKSAGYLRNRDMAKFGDILIAFWDGKSKGTQHMIELAKMYKLKIAVIRF